MAAAAGAGPKVRPGPVGLPNARTAKSSVQAVASSMSRALTMTILLDLTVSPKRERRPQFPDRRLEAFFCKQYDGQSVLVSDSFHGCQFKLRGVRLYAYEPA